MAPFPETEIMTIKRLQVALRRMDLKLLKDGAYKLHEKYHSGFKFEYFDLLKEILTQVSEDTIIPDEIKNILCPTIIDILSEESKEPKEVPLTNQPINQTTFSDLTQTSYNSSISKSNIMTEEKEESAHKISAFDVFGAPKSREPKNAYFELPQNRTTEIQNGAANSNETIINQIKTEPDYTESPIAEEQKFDFTETNEEETKQEKKEIPISLDKIAIYYGQDNSNEKIKNILNYKEIISKYDDEHYSISQILKLISEISVQSDTNVSELKNIIDQIKISGNKLSLITNSSSRELTDLFEKEEYSYSLYSEKDDKQMTLIPVFGLTNQYICSNCAEEYLDKNNPIKPLVIECPKCKNPMFPNFYGANNKSSQINITYYNNALVSLASSKIWVLIHPSTEDKLLCGMLINAFKLNREIKTIYILEKDINIRETFKGVFTTINENVKINVQMTALEDFINSLK